MHYTLEHFANYQVALGFKGHFAAAEQENGTETIEEDVGELMELFFNGLAIN